VSAWWYLAIAAAVVLVLNVVLVLVLMVAGEPSESADERHVDA
jgi:hypothetical protein